MSTSLTGSTTSSEEIILQWQVHLARQEPQRLAAVIAMIALAALSGLFLFRSPIPAVVIAFVLVGALSDYLLPMTFTLTRTHASSSTKLGKRIIAWQDVRKCYLDEYGVKLSPLRRRSRLEAYRGVYLRFGDNREDVIEAVRKLRPKDV